MSKPLSIIDVDRTDDGVIVTFSNGAATLFHTHFLYEVRGADGNIPLPPIEVDRRSHVSLQNGEQPH